MQEPVLKDDIEGKIPMTTEPSAPIELDETIQEITMTIEDYPSSSNLKTNIVLDIEEPSPPGQGDTDSSNNTQTSANETLNEITPAVPIQVEVAQTCFKTAVSKLKNHLSFTYSDASVQRQAPSKPMDQQMV